MKSGRQNGFTLIELMITVVVIGILASIVYPSYTQYMLQARRAEAQSDMLKMQLGMEKWRGNRASYRSDATASSVGTSNATAQSSWAGFDFTNAYYTYTITDSTGSAYTINATAIVNKSQANDTSCTSLTLNMSGTKLPLGCWKR